MNLIKNQAGEWNFASMGHPPEIGTSPGQETPPKAETNPKPKKELTKAPTEPNTTSQNSTPEQQVSLGELTIQDGQISLLDQSQSKTPSLYDHIDVKNFSMNTPFTVDAAVHMAGTGEQALTLQGQGGPIAEQDLSKTPFHGTLELKQVSIGDLTKFLNSPALTGTDGVMSGRTNISNDAGRVTAEGQTNIQNAKFAGWNWVIRSSHNTT